MPRFQKNNWVHFVFWLFVFVGILFIFIANTTYERFIQDLYQNKNFEVLNFLTAQTSHQSLDYYRGKFMDVFLGPVTNVFFYAVFVLFCLMYLRFLTPGLFCYSVFIFLVISKCNILFYPPYGDAIGGPFAEGIWLLKNNFNYGRLFHQPGYDLGGARVYFFSLYPTYLAVLYKIFPKIKVFLVVNHLVVYYMSAVIVTLTRSILLKVFEAKISILGAIVLLALPLFQSQTEAINMEIPCLFFSMLSIYALIEKKAGKACLFSLLAVLFKGHAILICAAVALTSMLLFFFDAEKKFQKRLWVYAFLSCLFLALKVASKFFIQDQHVHLGIIAPLSGWPSMQKLWHVKWFLLAGIFLITLFVYKGIKEKTFFHLVVSEYYPLCVVFIAALMWYVLFLNFSVISPRYQLELMPFLIMVFVSVLLPFKKFKKIQVSFLIIAVIIVSSASFGWSHNGQGRTYHVLTERNLQYRNDLQLNRELINFLEKHFKGYTIGAPFILAQMLNIPELGYVQVPFDVIVYGMNVKYGYDTIENFNGLNYVNLKKTLWLAVPADFEEIDGQTYPIHEKDVVLKKMELGDSFVTLFFGGLAIDKLFTLNVMRLYQIIQDKKTNVH